MSKEINRSKVLIALHAAKKLEAEARRLLDLLPQGEGSGLDADLVDGLHADEIVERCRKSIVVKAGGSGAVGIRDHALLLNVLADQHHAEDHKARHAGAGADAITSLGALTMTGDVDLAGNKLIFDDLAFDNYINDWVRLVEKGTTTVRNLAIQAMLAVELRSSATNFFIEARKILTSSIYFRVWNGATHNIVRLASGATPFIQFYDELRASDIIMGASKFLTFDKASGNGIKVDTTSPTFGWRDLLGEVFARNTGPTKPAFTTFRDGLFAFQFGVGDEEFLEFHMPHDYVKGTDIHLHIHWSHIGTLVNGGTVTFEYEMTYAKGHNQAPFPASVTGTVVGTASTTQYQHVISEGQVSVSGASGSQIDTDNLEPDGVIKCRIELQANDITVSSGGVPDPFIHYVDIHYQSTNIGTKDKAPDFYA